MLKAFAIANVSRRIPAMPSAQSRRTSRTLVHRADAVHADACTREHSRKQVNVATGALNRASLEAKDRDALVAIASALGVRAGDDTDTSALIDRILEHAPAAPASGGARRGAALGADGEPLSDWEIELAEHEGTPVAPDAAIAVVTVVVIVVTVAAAGGMTVVVAAVIAVVIAIVVDNTCNDSISLLWAVR